MGIFRTKYERELDRIIARLNMDLSNNYKDNAQDDLREFEAKLTQFSKQELLKEKSRIVYERQLQVYKDGMRGFSHKDQKPYWTRKDW